MKRIIIALASVMLMVLAFDQTNLKAGGEVRLSPRLLNYQGFLTDTLGNPITNPSVSVTFGIWSSSGGGTQIWYETQSISVTKGIFSAVMGNTTPIPDSVFTKGSDRWLEMTYAGITLSPRTRITSSGYALSATYSDTAFSVVNNAITTPKILDTAVTMAKLAPAGATTNQVIKWNGSMWQPATDVASSDTDWIFSGNNMYSGVSGNVGIGTTSPGALFTVSSTGSNYGNGIRMVNGANYWESVHDYLGGLTFGYNGADRFVISRSGNSYFTSGNVGIGTATPSYLLDVAGATRITSTLALPALRVDVDVDTNSMCNGTSLETSNASLGTLTCLNCYTGGAGTGERRGIYSHVYTPTAAASASYGIYVNNENRGSGTSYGGNFWATWGSGTKYGVYGYASLTTATNNNAYGVYGDAANAGSGPAYGGYFHGHAYGTNSCYGGYFRAEGDSTGTKYGVYSTVSGSAGTRWAGYFIGNVNVTGTLSKGSGSFLIDHPLDPQNKILRHNFVESPENLCLYRGKVKLNSSGEGKVEMPSYFKALTKETEATVTLTSIGRPFNTGYDWNKDYTQVTVYGESNREVSYIVMADRDDPVMKQLYRPVEEDKGNGNFTRGKLLYPRAYGYPENMGEDYERQQEANSARADAGKSQ